MTDFEHNGRESLLDAFLDGTLPAAERAAFLERLRQDESLRMQITRQEAIDAALRRAFDLDTQVTERCLAKVREKVVEHPIAGATEAESKLKLASPTTAPAKRSTLRSALALAAVLGLCVVAGWQIKEFVAPAAKPLVYEIQKWRSMDRIYADELAGGFKPAWVCTDDAGFAKATQREIGQGVILAQVPGLSALGWSYANTLSTNTLYLLATADETKILVFMMPVDHGREPIVEPESQLHLHQRTVGKSILYEVSPLPEPRVLPHFREAVP